MMVATGKFSFELYELYDEFSLCPIELKSEFKSVIKGDLIWNSVYMITPGSIVGFIMVTHKIFLFTGWFNN